MSESTVKNRLRASAALVLLAFSTSCVTPTNESPPAGRTTLTYEGVKASVWLPIPLRERAVRPPSPNWLVFETDVGNEQTIRATLQIEKAPDNVTELDILGWWMTRFEKELPNSSTLEGADLLSVKRVGAARPQSLTSDHR